MHWTNFGTRARLKLPMKNRHLSNGLWSWVFTRPTVLFINLDEFTSLAVRYTTFAKIVATVTIKIRILVQINYSIMIILPIKKNKKHIKRKRLTKFLFSTKFIYFTARQVHLKILYKTERAIKFIKWRFNSFALKKFPIP